MCVSPSCSIKTVYRCDKSFIALTCFTFVFNEKKIGPLQVRDGALPSGVSRRPRVGFLQDALCMLDPCLYFSDTTNSRLTLTYQSVSLNRKEALQICWPCELSSPFARVNKCVDGITKNLRLHFNIRVVYDHHTQLIVEIFLDHGFSCVFLRQQSLLTYFALQVDVKDHLVRTVGQLVNFLPMLRNQIMKFPERHDHEVRLAHSL